MGMPYPRSTAAAGGQPVLRARGRGARPRSTRRSRSRSPRTSRSGPSRSTQRHRGAEAAVPARPCAGRKLWSFGLTEPEAGSDAGNVRTTAKRENGEWVINGAKQFITNAGTDISGGVTITARTGDSEVSNIIVPKDTPGYTVEAELPQDGLERIGHAATGLRQRARARGEPARRSRACSFHLSWRRSTAGASACRRWASAWPRARSTRHWPTPRSASAWSSAPCTSHAIADTLMRPPSSVSGIGGSPSGQVLLGHARVVEGQWPRVRCVSHLA